ncbi:hypothetical protein RFI_00503 [Reticulomyxa filosa]|uniref:Uncharacterized protein n=1 Tax=Reticulomyxa filosa TaxID=46433 RepID=X6PET9_RETFI|nr:hypothetical protein RFI_00503 [Reticulomyxa filosa]|eukprot:ETO36559.1 hypothetical protein RFI_00503 [Reticulomyxa filosa]
MLETISSKLNEQQMIKAVKFLSNESKIKGNEICDSCVKSLQIITSKWNLDNDQWFPQINDLLEGLKSKDKKEREGSHRILSGIPNDKWRHLTITVLKNKKIDLELLALGLWKYSQFSQNDIGNNSDAFNKLEEYYEE